MNYKHGLTGTKIYYTWKNIKRACDNCKGIIMDKSWVNDPIQFQKDVGDPIGKNYYLRRIDETKNYTKDNVAWFKKRSKYEREVYNIWFDIMRRCYNSEHSRYKDYGGRGIKVYERWKSFDNFFEDLPTRPSNKHSIDRIDNKEGNYEPENVRWATVYQQAQNQRLRRNTSSKYKGVSYYKRNKKYVVSISYTEDTKHIQIYLGSFDSEQEAALIYDEASEKYHDIDARVLNKEEFPEIMRLYLEREV